MQMSEKMEESDAMEDSEEMEISENINNPKAGNSHPQGEEYIQIDLAKHKFDFFMIFFTFAFFTLFYANAGFRDWLDFNMIFIGSRIDLMILLFPIFIIPFFLYWIFFVIRIIRFFWASYGTYKIRAYFKIGRINFCLFGIINIFSAVNLNALALDFWPLFYGILGVFLFNFIGYVIIPFLDYKQAIEEEKRVAEEFATKFNTRRLRVTGFQLVIFFAAVFFVILYISAPDITNSVNSFYERISPDYALVVIFWVTISFAVFWFLIDYIYLVISDFFLSKSDTFSKIAKIVYLICFFYFIIKILLYNLPFFVPEPYTSLVSFGGSIGGGLITRFIPSMVKNKLKNEDKK